MNVACEMESVDKKYVRIKALRSVLTLPVLNRQGIFLPIFRTKNIAE